MASGIMSSHCPHVSTVGDYTQEDITHKKEIGKCEACGFSGMNLWVCLHSDCLFLGCGECGSNHSLKHFLDCNRHALTLNVYTLRVWCYECQSEVFLENNNPNLNQKYNSTSKVVYVADPDSEDEDETFAPDIDSIKPRDQNNKCVLCLNKHCFIHQLINSVVLCFSPELTNFFRDCSGFVRSNKKPGLAKNYMRLMKEMWHVKRPSYVAPNGIAYGMRMLFPVFRGYTHQDAQEFLRCFMDQLHEELKETRIEVDSQNYSVLATDIALNEKEFINCLVDQSELNLIPRPAEESSQSEADFETCDSGLSSEKNSQCEENDSLEPEEDSIEEDTPRENEQKEVTSNIRMNGEWNVALGNIVEATKNRYSAECAKSNINFSTRQISENHHASFSYLPLSKYNIPHHSLNKFISLSPHKAKSYFSVISDIFDGKILSSVQCLTCDTISVTKETFQDLSLPIPSRDHLHMLHSSSSHLQKCGDVRFNQSWLSSLVGWFLSWFWGPIISLQDCLAAFFSADELKGENMYSCEKCKKLRNGMKYSKVLQLPEILCIHLKRFRHEVMFSSKIGNYVSFPLEGLDLAPFLHKAGHYITYALNYLNEQWYEYDDQYVTAVDPQVVQNCEAYVLFYRKSCDEIIKMRQRCVDLMELSKNEFGLLHFYISKQWINKFNYFAEPGPITNYDFLCAHG
ncbi:USP20, partial [Cordylochernes scorpioides]